MQTQVCSRHLKQINKLWETECWMLRNQGKSDSRHLQSTVAKFCCQAGTFVSSCLIYCPVASSRAKLECPRYSLATSPASFQPNLRLCTPIQQKPTATGLASKCTSAASHKQQIRYQRFASTPAKPCAVICCLAARASTAKHISAAVAHQSKNKLNST